MPGATKVTDRTIRNALAGLYPKEIWYFISSFIFLLSVVHLLASPASSKRGTTSLRRIPAAVVNAWRIIAFRSTLQIGKSYSICLADMFVIFVYILVLFVWALVNTTDLEGVKFDWTFYSNRAGTLAASQFPLITVLGTKNNVLTLLTGISYEKMNNLHRMSARVLLVLLWLHAGSKLVMPKGIDADQVGTFWLNIGYASVFAFSLLALVSIRPVRAVAYEFFFYMHFALAFVVLLGGVYHTANFNYSHYVWPSFLVWGLDRFIRLLRVIIYAVSPHLTRAKSTTDQTTEVSARADMLSPDLVRLRVPRPPGFSWSPGQLSYIIVPSISRLPFEAHPFSIASIHDAELETESHSAEKGKEHWSDIVFLISARKGFTRRLADKLSQKGESTMKVLLDGPYGSSPDLDSSDTVVLIAGGTGISYTLPLLLSLAKKGRCRRVHFIWSVRDSNHLRWVSPTIVKALSLAPTSMSISISIYVTASSIIDLPKHSNFANIDLNSMPAESTESLNTGHGTSLTLEKTATGVDLFDLRAVQVLFTRPKFDKLIHSEMEGADGHTSVCVCGSQGIARAVRSSVRVNPFAGPNSILKGAPSVTLHVESFGYA
ncbi:hypothetical protein NEOLEDRAFT_1164338 [Neolentinus lepideus HHB14362 ss-1]|uniref:ferric-chelate reductase (NADPH) n=1 Tax=Neolentinus lepideus HHB14362 ss-1 TaxID=1314782 RepID=A0A165Q6M6_9AGAM|nr:hypothetical protein NEOLEDRAFT_1164338 [Neolentinus lepideus HHB14362 ss-1]